MSDRRFDVRFASSRALPGVEAYRVAITGALPPRRAMGAYLIGTVIQGEIEEYGRRESHRFATRDVVFVNPDEVFGPVKLHAPRVEFVGVLIEPAAFASAVKRNVGEPWFRRFNGGSDPRMSSAIERTAKAIESDANEEEQRSAFEALMIAAMPELGVDVEPRSPARRAILEIKEHLRAHFAEKIMLEDLEAASGLSRFHLVRRFTAEVGLPPHTYQVSLRVDRARDLIRRGASPVTVATAVGFADQSHLTRHFKRRVGMTPGAYAQSVGPKR